MPSMPAGCQSLTSTMTLLARSSQVLLLPIDVEGTSVPSSRIAETSTTAVSMGP